MVMVWAEPRCAQLDMQVWSIPRRHTQDTKALEAIACEIEASKAAMRLLVRVKLVHLAPPAV